MSIHAGKILRIDLTTKSISQEDAQRYEERFIGGRGVGAWILFNEMPSGAKPTDPESLLLIDTSPLSAIFPSSGRTSISSMNCMTGGVNWTNVGGSFGSELRRTGWSHIVIQGQSEEPVYLCVRDDDVELRRAAHLWGRDVWDCENILCDELADPDIQTLCIGPAGENLVPMAIVISNRTRAAGGGGVGCIFGSKNLKAIAVRGTKEIPTVDPDRFGKIREDVRKKLTESQLTQILRELDCFGAYIDTGNNACIQPRRNTQDDHFDHLDESSVALEKWLKLRTGEIRPSCFDCPINCGSHILEARQGPFKGLTIRVPENNTFYAYATRCDMRSPSNILKVFEQVSRYGLDQDAVGVVISWAFECYEKGILSREETDWLDLTWGNDLAVIALIEKIARRQGFGELLGKGCKRASEIIGKGSEYYCTHLKGQDNLDAVRSMKAWGFGNVVSLRGGRHLDGSPATEMFPAEMIPGNPSELGDDLFGVPTAFEPTKYEGKGKLVAWTSNFKAAVDSTGICYFGTYWGSLEHCGPDDLAEALSAATGREMSAEEFLRTGERILNIEKAFNTLHAGFTRQDDYPPPVYMKEPIKTGQYEGELVTKEGHDVMLNEFYDTHGWDQKTSWQLEETLRNLELSEVAEKLGKAGKLPV